MNIRAFAALSMLAVPAYVMAADDAEQYTAQDYVNEEIEIATSAVDILEKLTGENVGKMGELAGALHRRMIDLNGKYWANAEKIIEAQRDEKNKERFYALLDRFEEVMGNVSQLQQEAQNQELEDVVDKLTDICDAFLPKKTAPIGAPSK